MSGDGPMSGDGGAAVIEARGLTKHYGQVIAMDDCDFDLRPGEILAVIGDNGAGKSTLIKSLTGAVVPDSGTMRLDGEVVQFRSPLDARRAGIETVYQELGVAPALDITQNLFLGREQRRPGLLGTVFRKLDKPAMRREAAQQMVDLGIRVQSIRQQVETLSGGQRQAVAVARVAAWATRVVVMDEPTAALGVRETNQVLDLILRVRENGLPVVLISHNMPNVFQVADRIHIHRLGRRVALVQPRTTSMEEVVAVMTGARPPDTLAPLDPTS
ncbi:ATP-binding cassette domain-containing protein [Pseudonocardia sp. GCM10023141]|uniref:ATP-binding cassette domain-containing protein n=1 Tax=Pseudonocardia sp. GCM10023141 TaxID=3252653 RepID=UPI0036170126